VRSIDNAQTVRRVTTLIAVALLGTPGCSSLIIGRCAEPSSERLAMEPEKLSATGLFAAASSETLGADVIAYRPRFELWSDGAAKRRWVYLPPGARIDTQDMDAWQFPVGTKFWKEFAVGGVRVETRLLHKVGPDPADWVALAYVWDGAGTEAIATPEGRDDARGTPHDVPSAGKCMGCHGGTRSHILGFGAIQLAHDAPADQMSLARLVGDGRLTKPPPSTPRVPGDETAQQALGYLHANCSHCHNQDRPASTGPRCFDPRKDFDLSLRIGRLATLKTTPVYATAVGSIVTPGDADGSTLMVRFGSGTFYRSRMPSLGTETVDPDALRLLRAWIENMPRK
jgi:hypothetical protein